MISVNHNYKLSVFLHDGSVKLNFGIGNTNFCNFAEFPKTVLGKLLMSY